MASLEMKAVACYKTLLQPLRMSYELYEAGGREPVVCAFALYMKSWRGCTVKLLSEYLLFKKTSKRNSGTLLVNCTNRTFLNDKLIYFEA